MEVPNKFCSYFSSIGPNLPKKIEPPPSSHKDFLFESFRESIFFSPTTEDGSTKSKPYAENSKGCQIHPHCNSPCNLDSRQCRLQVTWFNCSFTWSFSFIVRGNCKCTWRTLGLKLPLHSKMCILCFTWLLYTFFRTFEIFGFISSEAFWNKFWKFF